MSDLLLRDVRRALDRRSSGVTDRTTTYRQWATEALPDGTPRLRLGGVLG